VRVIEAAENAEGDIEGRLEGDLLVATRRRSAEAVSVSARISTQRTLPSRRRMRNSISWRPVDCAM